MLFKLTEWQGAGDRWHCAHTDSFPRNVQLWVVPARILGLSADEFLQFVLDNYKPEHVTFTGNLLLFSWDKQSDMRAYKNFINKKAREINFQV